MAMATSLVGLFMPMLLLRVLEVGGLLRELY